MHVSGPRWIETVRRLIEHQQPRLGQQRGSQAESLPLGSVRQTVVRHTERPVVVARTESS